MSAANAFACIAAACLKHFRLNEAALGWSRDREALHQARVALRRLRSLCSISKSLFRDQRFVHLRQELKWLASELGDARNIDVMIDRESSEALVHCLQKARDDAYATAEAALSSSRARALMVDACEWISIKDWRTNGPDIKQPARDFASSTLDKLARQVAKDGKNLVDADEEKCHAVRIAAKKLRYAAEFFEPLYKKAKRYRRFITAISNLQEELGLLNDLATIPLMLESLRLSNVEGADALVGAVDKAKHLKRAATAHDNFVATKPFWH